MILKYFLEEISLLEERKQNFIKGLTKNHWCSLSNYSANNFTLLLGTVGDKEHAKGVLEQGVIKRRKMR